jgi:acetyl esterase/lipase
MKTTLTIFLLAPFLMAAAPRPAPEGVTIERDLTYLATERKEKLDLYQPSARDAKNLSPAVVIIHGGGWVGGDKAADREFTTGTTLAKAGYVCVSIEYWKGSKDRWPTNLQDCKNAVRWLRVNAGRLRIDPERIGVIGGSAGGHLALMVAYTAGRVELDPKPLYPGVSDRVLACVDMYGIANLATRQGTDKDGTPNGQMDGTTQLFPESLTAAPEKWKQASPVSYIQRGCPPTLILHGTNDTTVDRDQSKELEKALKTAGVVSKLIMVEGANHAWPLKTAKFDYTGDVVSFFDKYVKSAVRPSAP